MFVLKGIGEGIRAWFRVAFLVLFLTVCWSSDYRPTPLDQVTAPYRYDFLTWEATHFFDKWARKARDFLPGTGSAATGAAAEEERRTQVLEFFELGRRSRELESPYLAGEPGGQEADGRISLIQDLKERHTALQRNVEEIVESEINAALMDEGFFSWGGTVIPPVDTHFSDPPAVLVLSPRDCIARLQTVVLRPGIADADRSSLEEQILEEQDLAALVINIGGIASYPSIVVETGDLRRALDTIAHEWLHHWFFFKPLGQGYWDSPEMTTLNETAAAIGGVELGRRAYASLMGKPPDEPAPGDPASGGAETQEERPAGFNFAEAMRETRRRTEELLDQGHVEGAEGYMEQRRRLLAERGYRIRKINQAYFAFRESYATTPGSISPVGGQLEELRRRSGSLGDFLRTVAGFSSYGEFLEHLESGR